jgi:hypothetical protein
MQAIIAGPGRNARFRGLGHDGLGPGLPFSDRPTRVTQKDCEEGAVALDTLNAQVARHLATLASCAEGAAVRGPLCVRL